MCFQALDHRQRCDQSDATTGDDQRQSPDSLDGCRLFFTVIRFSSWETVSELI